MAFAVSEGDIEDDPSRLGNQRKSRKPVKHVPWSTSDVSVFRKRWAIAEGGATPHLTGAWTGHESLKEIEEYTKDVSRKKLLSGTEAGTQIVQVKKS
ncbi:MAG: hypothetical protein JKY94_11290 [Rhodobacteraceae bacterium]|nr:hypothetical protein [Paracoccaceae bacterium]